MKISISKTAYASKPDQQKISTILQRANQYVVIDETPQEVYKQITSGHCWRPGLYKEGATTSTKESFIGAEVLALDFDDMEAEPQEIVEYCRKLGIEPNFWYYTFRQGQTPLNRYRIVWYLDTFLNQVEYEVLYERLLADKVFTQADHKPKDISRLWIGTNKGGQFIKETPTTISAFDKVLKNDIVIELKQEKIKKRAEYKQTDIDTQLSCELSSAVEWWNDLKYNCELWRAWVNQEPYLEYNQRLLLWFNLKNIIYSGMTVDESRQRTLDIIMSYYNANVYKGSKCNKTQIEKKLYDKRGIAEPIIFNNSYTVAEWYNTINIKLERQSLEDEDKQMNDFIPQVLEESGIKYVECQTEAGKTERILQYLSKQDYSKRKIIYAVPTYILIQEARERLKNMGFTDVKTPQKIDYDEKQEMYLAFAFIKNIKQTEEMINRKKEIDEVISTDKGLFIITHSLLSHIRNVKADLIICDENIEDYLCSRHIIKEDVLTSLYPFYDKYFDSKGNEVGGRAIVERLFTFIHDNKRGTKIDYDKFELNKVFFGFKPDMAINRLDKDKAKDIGLLERAENIRVGIDKDGVKYVYFENPSRILRIAYLNKIPLKLFTGTPKIYQLRASLKRDKIYGEKLMKEIGEPLKITRADTMGRVFRFCKTGATGSKHSIENGKTIEFAKEVLTELGVDWQNTNCLTLKACKEKLKKEHFKIPQVEINGELKDLYIENCAGYDGLKGQDLIVIGKPEIELNAYLDMIDIEDGENIALTTKPRVIEDTGKIININGYDNDDIWPLQAEQIRERLEQAVGRARSLRFQCNVYVFADYALRNEYRRVIK